MKKTFKYFIAPIVVLLAVVGCKEQRDVNAEWKAENELYFIEVLNSKQYEVWELPQGDVLPVKWITRGPEEGVAPKASSTVKCHYRGWDKSGKVFTNRLRVTRQPAQTSRWTRSQIN